MTALTSLMHTAEIKSCGALEFQCVGEPGRRSDKLRDVLCPSVQCFFALAHELVPLIHGSDTEIVPLWWFKILSATCGATPRRAIPEIPFDVDREVSSRLPWTRGRDASSPLRILGMRRSIKREHQRTCLRHPLKDAQCFRAEVDSMRLPII